MTPPQIATGDRFRFGANWREFAQHLNDARIAAATDSLRQMLGVASLQGRTVVDVGSGSGLFSLAAVRLGAARVHSFDYDPDSVSCTGAVRQRFAPDAPWTVERGSALDRAYLARLGTFDIVYSWGVLHHTGAMWDALDAVAGLVAPGGRLFVSLYNDQGLKSRLWTLEKRLYVRHRWLRPLLISGAMAAIGAGDLLRGRAPWTRYRRQQLRGMSSYYDLLDWLGGYPFEVARPDDLESFYRRRGFAVANRALVGGRSGCNEFVLQAPGGDV